MKISNDDKVENEIKTFLNENSNTKTNQTSDIEKNLNSIDQIFGKDENDFQKILTELNKESSPFIQSIKKKILSKSPTSLIVTFHLIKLGFSSNDLKFAFEMDYRLANKLVQRNDFNEGVNAVIIRKDNLPKWSPKDFNEIDLVDLIFKKYSVDLELF
jgi:enoyl-CoA hydratase